MNNKLLSSSLLARLLPHLPLRHRRSLEAVAVVAAAAAAAWRRGGISVVACTSAAWEEAHFGGGRFGGARFAHGGFAPAGFHAGFSRIRVPPRLPSPLPSLCVRWRAFRLRRLRQLLAQNMDAIWTAMGRRLRLWLRLLALPNCIVTEATPRLVIMVWRLPRRRRTRLVIVPVPIAPAQLRAPRIRSMRILTIEADFR